ncbi:peptide/nickel transport system permease protein [Actinocorallia herbida]|uniref:Peptide/nickel transport system permease protein n=1 Tax=Actinocorallia herbida TaxID=58109 RepID=A0A3N1CYF1_9ACTN|nr:ABC transporter permease [Actinocorallia herbida]ROO86314.1 peptide/nickel transport system permease protein [Actinocorallia herbida]
MATASLKRPDASRARPAVPAWLPWTVLLWAVRLAVTVLGILTLLFALLHLSGDPAAVLVGPGGSAEDLARVRAQLGLDDPFLDQYLAFLGDVARLDFGNARGSGEAALPSVLAKLPLTLQLVVSTLALSLALGLPLGVLAAARRDGLLGRVVSGAAALGQAVPNFVLGLVLLLVFALWLGWLPSYGSTTPAHTVLPVVTLTLFTLARVVLLTRAGVLDALSQDFCRAVTAKGGSHARVLWRHALPNAFPPVLAFLITDTGYLLSGTVLVEQLYAYDGIGRGLVVAIGEQDYPTVQATVFTVAVIVVAVSALGDLLGRVADPRVGRESAG